MSEQNHFEEQPQGQQAQASTYDPFASAKALRAEEEVFALPVKPKKKRTWIVVVAILLVLALGSGTMVGWLFFRPDIKVALMGTRDYWDQLEQINLTSLSAKAQMPLQLQLQDDDWSKYRSEMELTAAIDDPNEMIPQKAMEYLNGMKISVNQETDTQAGKSKQELKLTLQDLITLSAEGVTGDGKTLLRVPQANDQYIDIDNAYMPYKTPDEALQNITGKSYDELQAIFDEYFREVVLANIPEDGIVFNTSDVYDNIECNSLTITVNKDTAKVICDAFAAKLKDDERISQILLEMVNVEPLYEDEDEAKEQIEDAIQSLADDIAEADYEDFSQMTIKVWFDNNEQILARKLWNDDVQVELYSYFDEGTYNCGLTVKDLYDELDILDFSAKGEIMENGFDGTASFKMYAFFSTITIDWENTVAEDGTNNGKITMSEETDYSGMWSYTEADSEPVESTPLVVEYSLKTSKTGLHVSTGTIKITYDTMSGMSGTSAEPLVFNMEIKEITPDLKYGITIEMPANDLLSDVSFKLEGTLVLTRLDACDIPDVNTLDAVSVKDLDIEEYFSKLAENPDLQAAYEQFFGYSDEYYYDEEYTGDEGYTFEG